MTEIEAGEKIRELIDAGYLLPSRRYHPDIGEYTMPDEFVVWTPNGLGGRSKVLDVIHGRT